MRAAERAGHGGCGQRGRTLTQELFKYPPRDERWTGHGHLGMPGFMQFLAGTYLFLGLTLFGTFTGSPPL
jgi:hypothetical protein